MRRAPCSSSTSRHCCATSAARMSQFSKSRLASIANSVLQPTDANGEHARSGLFEQVIDGLSQLISARCEVGTEILRFPPVMSRAIVEKSGYLKSFPHLLGCVSCLHGGEAAIRHLLEGAAGVRTWLS